MTTTIEEIWKKHAELWERHQAGEQVTVNPEDAEKQFLWFILRGIAYDQIPGDDAQAFASEMFDAYERVYKRMPTASVSFLKHD